MRDMKRVPNDQLAMNLPLLNDSPSRALLSQGFPIGACVVDFARNRVLAANDQIRGWLRVPDASISIEQLQAFMPGLAERAADLLGQGLESESHDSWQTELNCEGELPTQAWISLIPLAGDKSLWHLLLVYPSGMPSQMVGYTDAVTGLPDRRVLEGWRQHWRSGKPGGECPHALLFLDLNDFKQINDQHGHACGDSLLAIIAQRWRDSLRNDDLLVRYGGDEFVVLLAGVQSAEEAMPVVERLVNCSTAPIQVEGQDFLVSVSIGMALASSVSVSLEELLASADRDMYAQKHLADRRRSPV